MQRDMDVIAPLFTTPFLPFTVSILVMFGIGIIEAIGLGLSSIDFDFHVDGDHDGALCVLGLSDVPALMILVAFLLLFGLDGIIIQNVAESVFGDTMRLRYAVPLALVFSIPLLGVFGKLLSKVIPQDETTAIYSEEFIGKRAIIILGKATRSRQKIGWPLSAETSRRTTSH